MPAGVRKLLGTMIETSVGFKKRQRDRIIDRRLHAIGGQMRSELVAVRMPDGVEMIDVGAIGSDMRHDYILDLVEPGIIDCGRRLSCRRPARKMRKLCRQDRRLQTIQAAVDALDLVLMLAQVRRVAPASPSARRDRHAW